MNHQAVYEKIISNARNQKRIRVNGEYYENHHIIPKCINGSEEKDNKVLLTAREHFVCHKLLTYIYKENRKIVCAFHLMSIMNKRKYGITSRDYAYSIELIRNTPISKETKTKISLALTGKSKSPEHNEKNSQRHIGKKYSNETNKKKANVGDKNGMFNKHHSKESIENIRKKLKDKNISQKHKNNISKGLLNKPKKLCPHCNRLFDAGNYQKYHGDKCRLIYVH
jgi:hypothetical protein